MPDSIRADNRPLREDSRPPSSNSRITMWVVFALLLLLIIGVGGAALFVWNGLRPAAAKEPVLVEIPVGSSPFRVADILEEKGIIRNAFLFKYYLRYNDEGPRFQAGTYEMAPGITNEAIIAKLNAGDTVKAETFRFTVPEGYTVEQIAERLSGEGLVDRDAFLELADSPDIVDPTLRAAGIPEDAELGHRLEGYLFPETYEMEAGSGEDAILRRMLGELDRKLAQLPEGWEERLNELGISFHEMMTIASLIEREVVVDEERPLVAGVIYNRIREAMPLQIDATVQYALGKPKERLLNKDLQIDSPYNTYRIPGLPPGPIASPSLASIEAALYPETTTYLFYVTKKDGTQGHLFAETYNEHLKNIRISEQEGDAAGG